MKNEMEEKVLDFSQAYELAVMNTILGRKKYIIEILKVEEIGLK